MQHDQIHEDRWELIQFAKSQTKAKRPQEIPLQWDEGIVIKYRWDEAVSDKRSEFVDSEGSLLSQEALERFKAGDEMILTVDQNLFSFAISQVGKLTHEWVKP